MRRLLVLCLLLAPLALAALPGDVRAGDLEELQARVTDELARGIDSRVAVKSDAVLEAHLRSIDTVDGKGRRSAPMPASLAASASALASASDRSRQAASDAPSGASDVSGRATSMTCGAVARSRLACTVVARRPGPR